jgi:hypothetical protein
LTVGGGTTTTEEEEEEEPPPKIMRGIENDFNIDFFDWICSLIILMVRSA